jgi:hypothetical protein
MLGNQVTILKQFNGVVQSGPAYPVLVVFHFDVKGFYIEMPFGCINLLEDGVPLRGFAVTVTFEIIGKNVFYRFEI